MDANQNEQTSSCGDRKCQTRQTTDDLKADINRAIGVLENAASIGSEWFSINHFIFNAAYMVAMFKTKYPDIFEEKK